jgi:glycosyltransferase involved in cell wall biosynthesis
MPLGHVRTILQVYHTQSIGGVSSYLLNLSAGLIRRGYRVLLAAPPGPLTPQFERVGVHWLPMRISDWRLLRSRRELTEMIEREGVDLVNAHDYSAGAAAFLAARQTQTPYVLSVHCVRPWWQRWVVFYWSARVVTVSRALRDHLIIRMRLPPDRVIESFVGIDVERFAPGSASPSLYAELGLSPGQPVVLHVSRFSTTKSHVAIGLAEAAVPLAREHPELAVLLAGTGEDERRVRAAADCANTLLGRHAVRPLGSRMDVPELMRLATVVVGAGSVGLEALASGCPLIAAGKLSFCGLVTPANIAAAHACLFGDHAIPADTAPANYAAAILAVLSDPPRRAALAEWGRRVAERFSLERMVDQLATIYEEIGSRSKRHASLRSA